MRTAKQMVDEAVELTKKHFEGIPYVPFELCLRAIIIEEDFKIRRLQAKGFNQKGRSRK